MHSSARIVTRWVNRREAHLTIDGPNNGDLLGRLDQVLDKLIRAGANHLVVDLHRLTGPDVDVLDLLAATCLRLWARRGSMQARGMRGRLIARPELQTFPEALSHLREGRRIADRSAQGRRGAGSSRGCHADQADAS